MVEDEKGLASWPASKPAISRGERGPAAEAKHDIVHKFKTPTYRLKTQNVSSRRRVWVQDPGNKLKTQWISPRHSVFRGIGRYLGILGREHSLGVYLDRIVFRGVGRYWGMLGRESSLCVHKLRPRNRLSLLKTPKEATKQTKLTKHIESCNKHVRTQKENQTAFVKNKNRNMHLTT